MPIEKEYKRTCRNLGGALLLFLAFLAATSFAVSLFSLCANALSPTEYKVSFYLFYSFLYAASFLLPVLFYRVFQGVEKPVRAATAPRLTADFFLWLTLGIAVTTAMSTCNSYLLEIFEYESFSDSYVGMPEITNNTELVLSLLTYAVIPAFVEEYLFRGLVLGTLRPYGRDVAVLGSALLFGAMHQNAGQFLFAVAAGLVFGYLADKTGSIWCGVLIHFVNNFLSVFEEALVERLPGAVGYFYVLGIQTFFYALGILAFVLLALREKNTRVQLRKEGIYQKETVPSENDAPLPFERRVKLFFHPLIILFLVACGGKMIYYLVLSLMGAFL